MDLFNLIDELGGEDAFRTLVTEFYDRLFDDMIVGFFFAPHDKSLLITSQMAYLSATLGDRSGTYDGPSLRSAHRPMPILIGHFDRRHQILKDVIEKHNVIEEVRDAWLALDLSLRDSIIRMGEDRAEELLQDPTGSKIE